MVRLTARQKEKLITHSKKHTTTHINAMASLMRKGSTFGEAHKKVTRNEAKSKQKQKQTQIQRVVINLGGGGKSKRSGQRAAPRATTQGGSSQVLAEFSTMLPPPQSAAPPMNSFPQFTPPPTLTQPRPAPVTVRPPAVPVSKPVTLPTPTFVRPPSVKTQSLVGPAPLETPVLGPAPSAPPVLGRVKSVEENYREAILAATEAFERDVETEKKARDAAREANPPPEVANVMAAVAAAEAAPSGRAPTPEPPAAKKKRGVAKGTKRGPYKKPVTAAMMGTPVMAEAVPVAPRDLDPAGEDVRASMFIPQSARAEGARRKMAEAAPSDPYGQLTFVGPDAEM